MSPPPPALEKWLPFRPPNAAATMRLFCLPFAGGGASVYRPWAAGLPLTVELCAVQPPGRETRFREPAYTRLAPMVTDLADVLEPLLDLPAAFYGHSMGALTAFELCRAAALPKSADTVAFDRGWPASARQAAAWRAVAHVARCGISR